MFKMAIAFIVGAAIGAASTYFCVRGKIEDEIEKECEELRLYYRDKEQKKREEILKETGFDKVDFSDFPTKAVDDYMDPDKKKAMEEAYERLRSVAYPEEDMSEEDRRVEIMNEEINDKPRLIKAEEYENNNLFDKQEMFYYTGDSIITTEEGEVINDERYLFGDTLTKYGFKSNDEKMIHVRNGNISTDFEIEKIWGYYNG